jgi:2,3-bisphosphoglycerate-independent phosphoglycerate mutase
MEAPDECGHHGDLEHKIFSIEEIDKKVVKPIYEALKNANEDFSILVMPDHPTPIKTMTHDSTPVPFLIYRSNDEKDSGFNKYNEQNCRNSNLFVESGEQLMKMFLQK